MPIEIRKPTPDEQQQMRDWPIWEKEPSEFPWYYDEKETCLILEGDVTVESREQTVRFGPGDLVIFPQGLDCTWKISKAVRKHYQFG
ncbi:MAG: cupin domain-containing protein [Pirellulales bacterium]|nr:cupin domain-containing protein [Pirellulales bacterium]